jgi:hypothetical protein
MKRLFATFALLLAVSTSLSACAIYAAPPPAYAYAPVYYGHPYYHHEHRYGRW